MADYNNLYEDAFHQLDISASSFLITGGCGFIGSNLVEYLYTHKAKRIRVLDDLSNGFMKNIAPFVDSENFEFIEGDIRDIDVCQLACEDIDYVFHQAALGSVPRSINDPALTNSVNVDGFLNMLIAASDHQIKRFIYAASSSTYGDSKSLPKMEPQIGRPLSPYAITKYVNELYARIFDDTYGLECVGLRYFNVFGPRQDPKGAYAAVLPLFMDAVLHNKAPKINGDGGQTRDFTFIVNAVEANIRSLHADLSLENDKVFNVAFGENISINDLFSSLNQIAGTNIIAEHGPDRPGDIRDSLADISKARSLFSYNPRYDVKTGLKITFEWFRENQEFIKERK